MESLTAITASTGLLLLSASAVARLFAAGDQRKQLRPLLLAGFLLCALATLGNPLPAMLITGKLVAFALLLSAALWLPIHHRTGPIVLLLMVAATMVLDVASSHAMQAGDWLAASAVLLHWTLVIAWSGSLLAMLAHDGYHATTDEYPITAVQRHARLSLLSMAGLAASGTLLGFVLVHNGDAMQTSTYGRLLQVKLLVAAGLLPLAILQLRCLSGPVSTPGRGALYAEAACLLSLTLLAGLAGAERPPAHAPFINPQSWQLEWQDETVQVDLQPVAGRPGRLRLEFLLPRPGIDENLLFSLYSLDGSAGQRDLQALPAGPASYLGEATIAMPGTWRLQLSSRLPDSNPVETAIIREIPAPPLADDMRSQLMLKTIAWSPANLLTFTIAILLLAVAMWSLRLRLRRAAGDRLAATALCSLILGGYLLLSVIYVKTYPGSFDDNPEPFVVDVVRRGETLYQAQCSDCHGVAGRGDGPWAMARGGPIPDLSVAHMDTHLDGEIFWWLTYGIPSLDMPAFGDELSVRDRWTVIHFLRSLRHDVPAD